MEAAAELKSSAIKRRLTCKKNQPGQPKTTKQTAKATQTENVKTTQCINMHHRVKIHRLIAQTAEYCTEVNMAQRE